MKSKSLKQFAGALALLAFSTMIFAPEPAEAKWRDSSDELPGMDSNVGTYLAVGAGLIALIGIVALVKHSGKDDTPTPADSALATPADTAAAAGDAVEQSETQERGISSVFETEPAPRLGLYLGTLPAETSGTSRAFSDLSRVGVKVGLSLNF